VIDLGAGWSEEERRASVVVAEDEADFSYSAEIAATPARVWEAMTDPQAQMRWRVAIDRFDSESPGGRRGTGTVNHCVHGKDVIRQEIVDWKPSEYYSYDERNPGGDAVWTVQLDPLASGTGQPRTRLTWRMKLTGGIGQKVLMVAIRRRVDRILSENFAAVCGYLASADQPGDTARL
jgi:uncharacterized protein YndB with AHSA1/START domain